MISRILTGIVNLVNLVIKLILFIAILGASSFIYNKGHDLWLTRYIGGQVVPFSVQGDTVGTGFYIKYNENSYILTNRHICESYYYKINEDKDEYTYKDLIGVKAEIYKGINVEILFISQKHDLCLVESNTGKGLKLASSVDIRDFVYLIGHPRGLPLTFRKGYIVNFNRVNAAWIGTRFHPSMSVSVIGYGGNSGSPLINIYGRVAGIIFAGDRRYHTEMMAIPVTYIHQFFASYIDNITL